MKIVKFFYDYGEQEAWCKATEYPDGKMVKEVQGTIDWSDMKKYVGDRYVIIIDGEIEEAGRITNFYYNKDSIATVEFKSEVGNAFSMESGKDS